MKCVLNAFMCVVLLGVALASKGLSAASFTIDVPATANIFAAGHNNTVPFGGTFTGSNPPGPNGSSLHGGTLPLSIDLPLSGGVITFSSVTGSLNNGGSFVSNGPDGTVDYAPMNFSPIGGLSGLIHLDKTNFLAGVFLSATPPTGGAPPSLQFTSGAGGGGLISDTSATIRPLINQIFFIGDGIGSNGNQSVVVPVGATKLFFGIPDGANAKGAPDLYGDNRGLLRIQGNISGAETLSLVSDRVSAWADGWEKVTLSATLRDAAGQPKPNELVTITPSAGVLFDQLQITTDSNGVAKFVVRNDQLGAVTFTASTGGSGGSSSTPVQVDFQKRKIVILVQGIRTTLDCDQVGRCVGDTAGFGDLASRLSARGFDFNLAVPDRTDQVIWFSYGGGRIDSTTGRWIANSYSCSETAQNFSLSILMLFTMLNAIELEHPNTDFYLVGHSQGGLIALQSIANTFVGTNTRLAGVVTFDGALGGAPLGATKLTSEFTCWQGPAGGQLGELYRSATDHARQGTTVPFFCAFLGLCPGPLRTNDEMVRDFLGRNVAARIVTIGNVDDGVFRPRACRIDTPGGDLNIDNQSTQIVESAEVLFGRFGGNEPLPSAPVSSWRALNLQLGLDAYVATKCASNSHSQTLRTRSLDALNAIGNQIQ